MWSSRSDSSGCRSFLSNIISSSSPFVGDLHVKDFAPPSMTRTELNTDLVSPEYIHVPYLSPHYLVSHYSPSDLYFLYVYSSDCTLIFSPFCALPITLITLKCLTLCSYIALVLSDTLLFINTSFFISGTTSWWYSWSCTASTPALSGTLFPRCRTWNLYTVVFHGRSLFNFNSPCPFQLQQAVLESFPKVIQRWRPDRRSIVISSHWFPTCSESNHVFRSQQFAFTQVCS